MPKHPVKNAESIKPQASSHFDQLNLTRKALCLALRYLAPLEPTDSRAVSNEFVAMAAVEANIANPEAIQIINEALAEDEAQREAQGKSVGFPPSAAVIRESGQHPFHVSANLTLEQFFEWQKIQPETILLHLCERLSPSAEIADGFRQLFLALGEQSPYLTQKEFIGEILDALCEGVTNNKWPEAKEVKVLKLGESKKIIPIDNHRIESGNVYGPEDELLASEAEIVLTELNVTTETQETVSDPDDGLLNEPYDVAFLNQLLLQGTPAEAVDEAGHSLTFIHESAEDTINEEALRTARVALQSHMSLDMLHILADRGYSVDGIARTVINAYRQHLIDN